MNACLAQMKPRKHFTAVKLMLGCTHTTLPDSLVYCVTGAEWRDFNYAQNRVRQDMVQLYGNSRNLIPLNIGADSRGDRSLAVVFVLQVYSSHNYLHCPCMFQCCLQTGLALKCSPCQITASIPKHFDSMYTIVRSSVLRLPSFALPHLTSHVIIHPHLVCNCTTRVGS